MAALAKANAAKPLRPPAQHVLATMIEQRQAGSSYDRTAAELNGRDICTPQGSKSYAATTRQALLRNADPVPPKTEMAHAVYEDVM